MVDVMVIWKTVEMVFGQVEKARTVQPFLPRALKSQHREWRPTQGLSAGMDHPMVREQRSVPYRQHYEEAAHVYAIQRFFYV